MLEKYLEFDSERLKLGIWSGQLSLKDVHLKADAIYSHINQFFAENEASSNHFTKTKPPVRLKLVSGTIGDLHLNIPWQSLVWGQGDVKVELRNVVIVLALESLEETQERLRNMANASVDLSESSSTRSLPEAMDGVPEDAATKARRRYQKQKIVREAERRQLQRREIASWLHRVYKKEEEERQRMSLRVGDALVQKEGQLKSWLKGATKGFFWRFYAGLQMKIENLKVVIIQDSVEMGLIIPSIQVFAGAKKGSNRNVVSSSLQGGGGGGDEFDNNSGKLRDSHRGSATITKPPQNLVYESPDEDGEHVDKHIRILGLGIYVRRLSAVASKKLFRDQDRLLSDATPDNTMLQLADVSAKEYLLRPTELNVSYSLFYPFPPEKRKKQNKTASIANTLDSSAAEIETVTSSVAPSVASQSTS